MNTKRKNFFLILLHICLTLLIILQNPIAITLPFINIDSFPSDNYADEIIENLSLYYSDGENALGPPDGNYATIFSDYSSGLITLDLGRYEIALDGSGDDIIVYVESGDYIVKIGNNLSQPFITLGNGNITKGFDFASIGFEETRFVQIQCLGEESVNLDAVEVINLFTPIDDTDNPVINGPEDFSVYENSTKVSITWVVLDSTPWNYSILINGLEIESGEWIYSRIVYNWKEISIGETNFTLILYDFFGNNAKDTVIVEVLPLPTETNNYYFVFIVPVIVFYFINRRRNE